MNTLNKAVRNRAPHYLSGEVAAVANMSLAQLQQLVAGTYQASEDQLTALARRMGLI